MGISRLKFVVFSQERDTDKNLVVLHQQRSCWMNFDTCWVSPVRIQSQNHSRNFREKSRAENDVRSITTIVYPLFFLRFPYGKHFPYGKCEMDYPYDCKGNETETLEIINSQDQTGREQFIPTEISRVPRRCAASKSSIQEVQ